MFGGLSWRQLLCVRVLCTVFLLFFLGRLGSRDLRGTRSVEVVVGDDLLGMPRISLHLDPGAGPPHDPVEDPHLLHVRLAGAERLVRDLVGVQEHGLDLLQVLLDANRYEIVAMDGQADVPAAVLK